MIHRRDLLKGLGFATATSGLPGLSLAMAETDARLVFFVLRGAVDGLAICPAYGEGRYENLRGELALPSPGQDQGALKLDGLFAMHPSLRNCFDLYRDGQATLVHAVASPYRERSHFDGQDVLENGSDSAGSRRDGWLNRALKPLDGRFSSEAAIAMSQNTPLILRGENSVTSWAPSQMPGADQETLRRIAALYANDEFFSRRLQQALDSQAIAGEVGGMNSRRRRGNDAARSKALVQATAKFLTAADGPRVAVLESGGWDTHANQGSVNGVLANKLAELDRNIAELRSGLGSAWSDTVVVVATEFGRTVRVNGTRGTDHGTATVALLLGGAINGGNVLSDWPGLGSRDLYEDRDLYPTTDARGIFKAVLVEHMNISAGFTEREVFPDSSAAPMLEGLIRT